jgi:hypothetical protein
MKIGDKVKYPHVRNLKTLNFSITGTHRYGLAGACVLSMRPSVVIVTEKQAIALSIEKWQLIVRFRRLFARRPLDGRGAMTCGLCLLYKDECTRKGRSGRVRCPVYRASGYSQCVATPYSRACHALWFAELEVLFLKALVPNRKLQYKATGLLRNWEATEYMEAN